MLREAAPMPAGGQDSLVRISCRRDGAATGRSDHAMWLDHGELELAGPLREVVAAYEGSRITEPAM